MPERPVAGIVAFWSHQLPFDRVSNNCPNCLGYDWDNRATIKSPTLKLNCVEALVNCVEALVTSVLSNFSLRVGWHVPEYPKGGTEYDSPLPSGTQGVPP